MTICQICRFMLTASGILLVMGGSVQAQVGSGSSPGGSGTMGQGDITRPDAGGDTMRGDGATNPNRHHDRAPSGPMDQGRLESTKPGQGGDPTLRGRAPDSSGGNPMIPGGTNRPGGGTGSGSMGTPGGSGSSSGMGSGGGMGSSGGAGGGK